MDAPLLKFLNTPLHNANYHHQVANI